MPGYYESSSTTCSACHYSCSLCNATGSTACVSCNASLFRTLSGSSCLCMSQYYDDLSNELCQQCPYYCSTCTNATSCSTCDNTTRNTTDLSVCACLDKFYEGGVSLCLACASTCATCNNSVNCTSCDSNRRLSVELDCVCGDRTFEPNCESCNYSCLSCSGSNNSCHSCNGSAFRYLDSSTSSCLCYNNYYDDGATEECQPCHYSCQTCTNGSSCASCPTHR